MWQKSQIFGIGETWAGTRAGIYAKTIGVTAMTGAITGTFDNASAYCWCKLNLAFFIANSALVFIMVYVVIYAFLTMLALSFFVHAWETMSVISAFFYLLINSKCS